MPGSLSFKLVQSYSSVHEKRAQKESDALLSRINGFYSDIEQCTKIAEIFQRLVKENPKKINIRQCVELSPHLLFLEDNDLIHKEKETLTKEEAETVHKRLSSRCDQDQRRAHTTTTKFQKILNTNTAITSIIRDCLKSQDSLLSRINQRMGSGR